MTTLGVATLLVTAAAYQSQSAPAERLRAFAETTIVAAALRDSVRDRPDDAREAFRNLLALAARAPSESLAVADLDAAGRLGDAWAQAWSDSFLVRVLKRFRAWSPDARREKEICRPPKQFAPKEHANLVICLPDSALRLRQRADAGRGGITRRLA